MLIGNANRVPTGAGLINSNAANGAIEFQKGRYYNAAKYYIKASQAEPGNYIHFENAGICYYSNKNVQN